MLTLFISIYFQSHFIQFKREMYCLGLGANLAFITCSNQAQRAPDCDALQQVAVDADCLEQIAAADSSAAYSCTTPLGRNILQ